MLPTGVPGIGTAADEFGKGTWNASTCASHAVEGQAFRVRAGRMSSGTAARPVMRRRILSREDGTRPTGGGVFCLLYCGLSFWMFYYVAFRVRDLMGSLITGFLATLGVVCLAYTVRQTLSRRKFGETSVILEGGTPVAGGEAGGSILLPVQANEAAFVRAEMQCVQVIRGKDVRGRFTRVEKRIWSSEQSLGVVRAGERSQAPFRFELPGAPLVARGTEYIWELLISVDLPGLDLSRTFVIPVNLPPRGAGLARVAGAVDGRGAATSPVKSAGVTGAAVAAVGTAAARTASAPPPQRTVSAAPTRSAVQASDAGGGGADLAERSAWVLVLANLVPLAGILWLNWRVVDVVLLYWLENLIVGVVGVLRILTAQPEGLLNDGRSGNGGPIARPMLFKLGVAAFFMLHFGAFCYGHGIFLTILFGEKGDHWEIGRLLAREMSDLTLLIPLAALAASHLYSFWRNYLGRGESRAVSFDALMMRPYGRIFVVHIFIMASAFIAMRTSDQLWPALLFVVLKMAIDLYFHRRERRLASPG
jgi:hypothetical protein